MAVDREFQMRVITARMRTLTDDDLITQAQTRVSNNPSATGLMLELARRLDHHRKAAQLIRDAREAYEGASAKRENLVSYGYGVQDAARDADEYLKQNL